MNLRMFAVIVTAWSALGASTSFADVMVSSCGSGISFDSFGRGLEAAFHGGNYRFAGVDEGCYLLGIQQGRGVMASAGAGMGCGMDFDHGRAQALEASGFVDPNYGGSTSACLLAGFEAGQADLDIGARTGDASVVGQECVDAYRQGRRDAAQGSGYTFPSLSTQAMTCYNLGLHG